MSQLAQESVFSFQAASLSFAAFAVFDRSGTVDALPGFAAIARGALPFTIYVYSPAFGGCTQVNVQ